MTQSRKTMASPAVVQAQAVFGCSGNAVIGGGHAGHALGPAEALQLGRGGGEIERGVVPLVTERRVESAERQRKPVADGRHGSDVEAMEADLRFDRLRPELLHARVGARTSESGIDRVARALESVAVPVPVAPDLDAGAGEQPRREDPVHADGQLIESEVDPRRLGGNGSTAGELGHHLDARIVVRRADEESRESETGHLQPRTGRLAAVEGDLAFLRRSSQSDATHETRQRARAHSSSLAGIQEQAAQDAAGTVVLRIARAEEALALRRKGRKEREIPAGRFRAAEG